MGIDQYDAGEWPDDETLDILNADHALRLPRGEVRMVRGHVSVSHAPQPVLLDYTNFRGERSTRKVTPIRIGWEASEWHPEPQWVLTAFDHGKGAERSFALLDIHSIQRDQREIA